MRKKSFMINQLQEFENHCRNDVNITKRYEPGNIILKNLFKRNPQVESIINIESIIDYFPLNKDKLFKIIEYNEKIDLHCIFNFKISYQLLKISFHPDSPENNILTYINNKDSKEELLSSLLSSPPSNKHVYYLIYSFAQQCPCCKYYPLTHIFQKNKCMKIIENYNNYANYIMNFNKNKNETLCCDICVFPLFSPFWNKEKYILLNSRMTIFETNYQEFGSYLKSRSRVARKYPFPLEYNKDLILQKNNICKMLVSSVDGIIQLIFEYEYLISQQVIFD